MIKFIKGLIISFIILPVSVMSAPLEGHQLLEFCEKESKYLAQAQVFNQQRMPVSEAMRQFPKEAWEVVAYAYTWAVIPSEQGKVAAVVSFFNEVFLSCIAEMKGVEIEVE